MMRLLLILALGSIAFGAQAARPSPTDTTRLASRAQNITIIRDDWGIAHVYAKTDADVVFGALYAQAEDDFNRVETNYLNAMGRLAEAEGESKIYQDLRMKMFISPEALRKQYAESPAWLRQLMDAFARLLMASTFSSSPGFRESNIKLGCKFPSPAWKTFTAANPAASASS